MAGVKRQSNGEAKPIGPHPSTIRVSRPYMTQAGIEKQLQPLPNAEIQDKNQLEAREDNIRLQGVSWLDTTRRALQLPIRTFTTACVYYHKFRLAHPGVEFNWADAAAASLLTSCKVEDTLKKSKDILAAAYNVKMGPHEQVGSDDAMFEAPGRVVIGLERLVLESGAFDFRSRYPHQLLIKILRDMSRNGVSESEAQQAGRMAYTILTDVYRTFAPLKQTTSTMAIAALELAAHFIASSKESQSSSVRDYVQALDLKAWATTREEIMETLLDALDLYTHHTTSTLLGQKLGLEEFLKIRLAFNKECNESDIPRYTTVPEPSAEQTATTSSTLRVANGHPTPVSPPQPGVAQPAALISAQTNPKDETLRFMLNPRMASDEKQTVQKYYTEEWEEYEEEIEVSIPAPATRPRSKTPTRGPLGHRPHAMDRRDLDDRRPTGPRDERDRMRGRDHDLDRERARLRDRDRERERDRRYDERRYDDRRFDDRRRYDDRRVSRY